MSCADVAGKDDGAASHQRWYRRQEHVRTDHPPPEILPSCDSFLAWPY